MNMEGRIKEAMLDAAENTENAETLVLLVGYEGNQSLNNMIGTGANLVSILTHGLNHVLKMQPDDLEKDLRIKLAAIILGGIDNDAR